MKSLPTKDALANSGSHRRFSLSRSLCAVAWYVGPLMMRSGPSATIRSLLLPRLIPSNENKLSHRWRERALLRSLVLKSLRSYSSERPAVGFIDLLDASVPTSIDVSWNGCAKWFQLGNIGDLLIRRPPPAKPMRHVRAGSILEATDDMNVAVVILAI